MDINWKFKKDAQVFIGDHFWYCLVDGGYVDPAEILDDPEQLEELEKAIKIVASFEEAAYVSGAIKQM